MSRIIPDEQLEELKQSFRGKDTQWLKEAAELHIKYGKSIGSPVSAVLLDDKGKITADGYVPFFSRG